EKLDEGFIQRIYRTSAWVLLLVLLFVLGLGAFRVAWSITAGAALDLFVLHGFAVFARAIITPGCKPSRKLLIGAALLKLPALGAVLYFVVRCGWFNVFAFAGGVALIQTVIFLKAVGRFLEDRDADRDGQPFFARSRK
ncbi:MAG TPA: hypothetical protein VHR86_10895, partial [Armatimonadota bacterium]|nr:hypothetical protein [Armatimonadota bacterium]